jgi:hypothetical protein
MTMLDLWLPLALLGAAGAVAVLILWVGAVTLD